MLENSISSISRELEIMEMHVGQFVAAIPAKASEAISRVGVSAERAQESRSGPRTSAAVLLVENDFLTHSAPALKESPLK